MDEEIKGKGIHHTHKILLIFVVIIMLLFILPLVVMFIGAVKPGMALYKIPADLNPFKNLTLDNIKAVWKRVNLSQAFVNSFVYTVSICLITIFVGLTGGYAFAKRNFPGKKALFVVLLATMMMPRQIMLIPNYMVAYKLGLTNKPIGLILTSINCAYAIFMCRQYIKGIPNELIEAAEIDGCSNRRIFWDIIVKMSGPLIAELFIFTFISSWNDFVWQNVMISKKQFRTIPLALAYLDGTTDSVNTMGLKMAGASLSSIPMLLIFSYFQKYFIKGISDGSVKE